MIAIDEIFGKVISEHEAMKTILTDKYTIDIARPDCDKEDIGYSSTLYLIGSYRAICSGHGKSEQEAIDNMKTDFIKKKQESMAIFGGIGK